MLDITGIDKAELLAALHNNTNAIGLGHLQDIGRDLTVEEAQEVIDRAKRNGGADDASRMFGPYHGYKPMYFDYLFGRPLKVDIGGDRIDREDLYDRDSPSGEGTLARIVRELRRNR